MLLSSPFILLLTLPTLCFQLPLTWLSSWPGLTQLRGLRETLTLSWPGLFHTQVLFHPSLPAADHLSSLLDSLICVHPFLHHPPLPGCLLCARRCCAFKFQSPGPQALLFFWGKRCGLRQLQLGGSTLRRLLGHRGWPPDPAWGQNVRAGFLEEMTYGPSHKEG